MKKKLDILEDIALWLADGLASGHIGVIVTVERKATAVLRALIEMCGQRGLDWPWSKVVSSDAIPCLAPGFWRGKRILVFNELMHTGASTDGVMTELLDGGAKAKDICTGAYGVHVDMEDGDAAKKLPDYYRYRCLDESSYSALLDSIVEMLHSSGGLMLDTEHLELPVALHCSTNDFFRAFNLCGESIRFNAYDAQWADCLTVTEPVLLDLDGIRGKLPSGVELTTASSETICKLRVVPRGYGRFAIVPIWYPTVPLDSLLSWSERDSVPEFVCGALGSYKGPDEGRTRLAFSLTTIVAGMELLKSVAAALYELGKDAVDIGFPPRNEVPPHIGHLSAVYPTVSTSSLAAGLSDLRNSYNIKSRNRLKDLRWGDDETVAQVSSPTIRPEDCARIRRLLGVCLLKHRDAWLRWERELARVEGMAPSVAREEHRIFTWKEMMALAGRCGISEEHRPTAMDLLIDDATLVTTYAPQQCRMIRGYAFAAEEVCRRLRNEIMFVGMS